MDLMKGKERRTYNLYRVQGDGYHLFSRHVSSFVANIESRVCGAVAVENPRE